MKNNISQEWSGFNVIRKWHDSEIILSISWLKTRKITGINSRHILVTSEKQITLIR